jgi:hypothetical protein
MRPRCCADSHNYPSRNRRAGIVQSPPSCCHLPTRRSVSGLRCTRAAMRSGLTQAVLPPHRTTVHTPQQLLPAPNAGIHHLLGDLRGLHPRPEAPPHKINSLLVAHDIPDPITRQHLQVCRAASDYRSRWPCARRRVPWRTLASTRPIIGGGAHHELVLRIDRVPNEVRLGGDHLLCGRNG